MKRYVLTSEDMLVLRDGRPFGDAGVFGGTALDWPLPQTIAGMCRTALGFQRDANFFADPDRTREVLSIGLGQLLPHGMSDSGPEFLLPTPADMIFSDEEHKRAHLLRFSQLRDGEGSDVAHADWLYPMLDMKEKPARAPKFLRQQLALQYLDAKIPENGQLMDEADVVTTPVMDTRIHTAIDPGSRSVREGQLFAESSMYLVAETDDGRRSQNRFRLPDTGATCAGSHLRLSIGFGLTGLKDDETPPRSMYCGGERRRVDVVSSDVCTYPAPGDGLENLRFLKLLLTTHGDFGGWAPEWLVPEGKVGACDWVTEPLSGVRLCLRSAVLSGWDGVSGWDYAVKKPKAFRKLVRPGSLYLVELENPADSALLVEKLWGRSLCEEQSQQDHDGYGQVIIAKTSHISA